MTNLIQTTQVPPKVFFLIWNLYGKVPLPKDTTDWLDWDFHNPTQHQLSSSHFTEDTIYWSAWDQTASLSMPTKESKDLETLLPTASSGIVPDTSNPDINGLLIGQIAKAYNFELADALRDSYEAIAKVFNPELYDALYDLREAKDEALEEGFPVPSEIALENAERLLREMYLISPRRYEVYPTPDGEIAIDAPGGYGRSVLLLCDSEGSALCLVNMNGNHRRAHYDTTNTLPDGFVREALIELEQWDHKTP